MCSIICNSVQNKEQHKKKIRNKEAHTYILRQRDLKFEKRIFQVKLSMTLIYISWTKWINKDNIILLLYRQNEWKKNQLPPFYLQFISISTLLLPINSFPFWRNILRAYIFLNLRVLMGSHLWPIMTCTKSCSW